MKGNIDYIGYEEAMEAVKEGKIVFFYYRGMSVEIKPNCDLEYLRGKLMAHLSLTINDVIKGKYSAHLLHELKILPGYFEEVEKGIKTFEIRKNDRDYQVSDFLLLKEFDPKTKTYTGKEIRKRISYMTDFNQKENYVVMAIV
ncbi:hypothetical protein JOC94_002328 [Bacillus thermophilus]|nr:ASCH/PUA domain-containing protein [Siminovitchia thermophila]MBM7715341.1 hypothetical protein [Siminovitchia thermophila]